LISDALIKTMKLETHKGQGCDKTESYSLNKDKISISLKWLPEYRLIKTFKEVTNSGTSTWELEKKIIEPNQVKKVFSSRENYQTTDYTDIGDNESDPFLMNMINLGFVQHGASGFYDAQGNSLDGDHHHH
jgi:hypothetical protein